PHSPPSNPVPRDKVVVQGQTEPWSWFEGEVAVGGGRFAGEDVPEEGVAVGRVEEEEEFGDRRVEVGHDQVVVVELAGVGGDGKVGAGGHRPDLAGFADAADAVDVELDDVDGAAVDQLVETVAGEFVLAAGDRGIDGAGDLGVAVDLVGEDGFLQPGEVEPGV